MGEDKAILAGADVASHPLEHQWLQVHLVINNKNLERICHLFHPFQALSLQLLRVYVGVGK
jgi:hypothetical protein